MDYLQKIIGEIEVHSTEGIRDCFENGVSPNDLFKGIPLIYELTSEYLRSPDFKKCVRVFVEYGLQFDDKILLSVLLDDDAALGLLLKQNPAIVSNYFSLRSAFTPLRQVTLLHICAEFNHVNCARVLINHGADVNTRAAVDKNGFGGQTPIFHTVNQIRNRSIEMFDFLLENGAKLDIEVRGLIWGDSYEWETFIPAVNPISYATMGLMRQMHRNETDISTIVSRMMKHRYGIEYTPQNIPCKYLLS